MNYKVRYQDGTTSVRGDNLECIKRDAAKLKGREVPIIFLVEPNHKIEVNHDNIRD